MLDRRSFLKGAAAGGAMLAAGGLASRVLAQSAPRNIVHGDHLGLHPSNVSVARQHVGALSPMEFLTRFDTGTVTTENGRTVRSFQVTSAPTELEVARGVKFPAWTFNGMAPGPTLRATEGDLVRIRYVNADPHPHSMHFHGIHPAGMDGVFEHVAAGGEFTYEFEAEPVGLHLYHCHTPPIAKHISKGLFGTFIVDPKGTADSPPREPMTELVMVMNGWDVDFDGENEFYTVNGITNYYLDNPIPLKVGEKVRIYLVNVTEHDLINSFHLHANFFHYYPTGTMRTPRDFTDTVMLCQGERGILEFAYKFPGKYMFHAHQSEFTELGWVGMFNVTE